MKNRLLPLFIGFVSGVCSFFSISIYLSFSFGPGVVFGIALVIYLYLIGKKIKAASVALFVVASAISYYAAVFTTIASLEHFFQPLSYGFGGLVGGFLLGLSIKRLFVPLSIKQCLVLAVISAILAQSCVISTEFFGGPSELFLAPPTQSYVILYIVWQVGMLYIIANMVSHAKMKKK